MRLSEPSCPIAQLGSDNSGVQGSAHRGRQVRHLVVGHHEGGGGLYAAGTDRTGRHPEVPQRLRERQPLGRPAELDRGERTGAGADLDDPARLSAFFAAIRELRGTDLVLAYHDRSDGGLAVTLLEMAFAGRAGLEVELGPTARPVAALFAEELGAVLQVREADLGRVESVLARHGLGAFSRRIGRAALVTSEVMVLPPGSALVRSRGR